jgi:hypothetical protein
MEAIKNAELLTSVTLKTVISWTVDTSIFLTTTIMPIINSWIREKMWFLTQEQEDSQ